MCVSVSVCFVFGVNGLPALAWLEWSRRVEVEETVQGTVAPRQHISMAVTHPVSLTLSLFLCLTGCRFLEMAALLCLQFPEKLFGL